jgi:hypothetical protein
MQNHLNKKKPRKQATNRGACINELDRVPTSLEGGPTTRRKSDGMPNLTVRVGWRFRSSQPFTQILKLIMLLNIYFLGVGKRWSKTEVPPEIGEIKERHEKGPASSWKVGVSAFESGTCFRAAVRLQLVCPTPTAEHVFDGYSNHVWFYGHGWFISKHALMRWANLATWRNTSL